MPIDAFITQKVKGWQADLLRRLIALFQSVAPEMTTVIKWGQPTFELNGPFAYVKPAKAHVTVGFWRGIELSDPTGLLGEGERMRHFKLTAPEQLDEAVVRGLVKQAVEHNLAQGDPTKRAMKKK
jgi:hypothetical protein